MSEKRGSNWVDYANLGANIAEIGLISAANRKINEMAQLQYQQIERERLEDEIRQVVFETEHGLARLSEFEERAPLGVATAAVLVEALLDEMGVQPSSFRNFVDKDRVSKLRALVMDIGGRTLSQLPSQVQEESRKMFGKAVLLDKAQSMITSLEAVEKLAESENEWKKLDSRHNGGRRFLFRLWLAGLFGVPPLLCLAGYAGWDQSALGVLGIFAGALAGLGAIVAFFGAIAFEVEGYKELTQKRDAWKSQVQDSALSEPVRAAFGQDLGIEGYKKAVEEVVDFVKRALTSDKDGNPLPASLLEIALPSRLSQH